jgi:hypothetical protein
VKDVIVFPKREHIVLHRWKINLRGYIAVCHRIPVACSHLPKTPVGDFDFKGRDDFLGHSRGTTLVDFAFATQNPLKLQSAVSFYLAILRDLNSAELLFFEATQK